MRYGLLGYIGLAGMIAIILIAGGVITTWVREVEERHVKFRTDCEKAGGKIIVDRTQRYCFRKDAIISEMPRT